jgi:8-oxo-dGTP pyrophosphatase MutT (NUDIX family)
MTTIDAVRQKLSGHAPSLHGEAKRNEAAVAIVLWERADDLSLLMIRRAEHEGDRWSGHIAFPGGRIDAEDEGPQAAAERETLEEVGLALEPADRIGRLDDLLGFKESIVVAGFVYGLRDPGSLCLNHEVADAFWMPIAELLDDSRHVRRTFSYRDLSIELPALKVLEDGPVLWGITYRFVDQLLELLGHSIPSMPWDPEL